MILATAIDFKCRACLDQLCACAGDDSGAETPLASGAKRSPGMEEVVARMKDLATNRGDTLRRSKKSRASLRSTFRELCSSVEVSAERLYQHHVL